MSGTETLTPDTEQLALLNRGVRMWNAWREENPDVEVNLSNANLTSARLSGVNLSGANLSRTHLYSADLSGADLRRANLSYASLSKANLTGANLTGAVMYHANVHLTLMVDTVLPQEGDNQ